MFKIEISDEQPPGRRATRHWKKSARCNSGTCVEVLMLSDVVLIRDSKRSEPGAVIGVSSEEFIAFLDEACGFITPDDSVIRPIRIEHLADGGVVLRPADDRVALTYDVSEWRAFVDGALSGDFRVPVAA